MSKKFNLVFGETMIKQLKKAAKNNQLKTLLSKMLDKIEVLGPVCGELLESKLFLYELKNKHPPIRLYFRHDNKTNEINVFEYEMKTSPEKQKDTIQKIKRKISKT